jgi:uncharacterized protein (TIGR00290 family)
MVEKTLVSWSGGKDSCMALQEVLSDQRYQVVALLTTLTRDYERISMHGVRRTLLERQAESLGLRLHTLYISRGASNEEYESRMKEAIALYRADLVDSIVFGDLFLEDIKQYREQFLDSLGMRGVFPIWKADTSELIKRFIRSGYKARITCVDPKVLDASFAGRLIDEELLAELPDDVDPCGENGEFHSFVYNGPIFKEEVKVTIGETVLRDGFYFCDLLPG